MFDEYVWIMLLDIAERMVNERHLLGRHYRCVIRGNVYSYDELDVTDELFLEEILRRFIKVLLGLSLMCELWPRIVFELRYRRRNRVDDDNVIVFSEMSYSFPGLN